MAIVVGKFTIPATGTVVSGYLKMKSAPLGPADVFDIGAFYYEDTATAFATPVNIPAGGAWTVLTNDALGVNYKRLPDSVTDVYDGVSDQFDFSELSIGDCLNIRLDCEVTTTVADQEFSIKLEMAQGGVQHDVFFAGQQYVKSAGTVNVCVSNSIYISNANDRDLPSQFLCSSASAATVKINGFFATVMKRGFVIP